MSQLPATISDAAPDPEELAGLEAALARHALARERLGAVNLRALEEVQELGMRIETLQAEQGELTAAIERLRRAIATLNREGRERLHAAFGKVQEHFGALFVRLFGGGRAKLELTDLEDPLAAGEAHRVLPQVTAYQREEVGVLALVGAPAAQRPDDGVSIERRDVRRHRLVRHAARVGAGPHDRQVEAAGLPAGELGLDAHLLGAELHRRLVLERQDGITVPCPYRELQDVMLRFFADAFEGKVPVVTGLPAPVRDLDGDGAPDGTDPQPANPAAK